MCRSFIKTILCLTVLAFLTIGWGSGAHAQSSATPAKIQKNYQRLLGDLKKAFPDIKVKKKKGCKKKKKKRTSQQFELGSVLTPEQTPACLTTCAWASAWAMATCHATACVQCANGFGYCSEASAYAYAYSNSLACTTHCLNGEIAVPCNKPDPSGSSDVTILNGVNAQDNTQAFSINDSGVVVGEAFFVDTPLTVLQRPSSALRWDGGVASELCPNNQCGRYTSAVDINEHGEISGNFVDPGFDIFKAQGFVWVNGELRQLQPSAVAGSINNQHSILGTHYGPPEGYDHETILWSTTGQGQALDILGAIRNDLEAFELAMLNDAFGDFGEEPFTFQITDHNLGSLALSMNNSGAITGSALDEFSYSSDSGFVGKMNVLNAAFVVTGNQGQLLETQFTLSPQFQPTHIADSGEIIGFRLNGSYLAQAATWSNGQVQDLPNFSSPDGISLPVRMNNKRQVVGFVANRDGSNARAVVWQNGTLLDLNTKLSAASPWVLQKASDINSCGQIVGLAYNPTSQHYRGFLYTPPECR